MATTASYRVVAADGGHRLACRVTAEGPGGTVGLTSASVLVPRAPSFSIRLRVARASASRLREHGFGVTITVPRPCTVTIRVLVLRVTAKGVLTKVLATTRRHFPSAGRATIRFGARTLSRLRRGEMLRVSASARSGSVTSSPAATTVTR